MPSSFDALDAKLSRAVQKAFGETCGATLRPRTSSQYIERTTDFTRPFMTIEGIFSAGSAEAPIRGNSPGEFAGTTQLASMTAEFWISREQAALIPYAVKVGDLLVINTLTGETNFGIVRFQKSNVGDLNMVLVAEGDLPTPLSAPLS